MPVIRLQDVKVEEFEMSELEILNLNPEHSLAKIQKLALEACSHR
jgi:hypothetical protein